MMRVVAAASVAVFCARAAKEPLPDVESVLLKASGKAQNFAQQAFEMQKRLQEQQEKDRAAVTTLKASLEQRLYSQGNLTKAIKEKSAELVAGNDKLVRLNSASMEEVRRLADMNTKMRAVMQTLTDNVSAAERFLADSLKVTDDSDAPDLKILAPTTPKPTLAHFLAVTSAEQDVPKASLIQAAAKFDEEFAEKPLVRSHSVASSRKLSLLSFGSSRGDESKKADDPMEMVSGLSTSLAEIAAAQVEGAAELKAHFLARFEEGNQRQAKANQTQTELLHQQAKLKERRAEVLTAKFHLETTHEQLVGRLRAVRLFAGKVDKSLVAALPSEAAPAVMVKPVLTTQTAKKETPIPATHVAKKEALASTTQAAKKAARADSKQVDSTWKPVPDASFRRIATETEAATQGTAGAWGSWFGSTLNLR